MALWGGKIPREMLLPVVFQHLRFILRINLHCYGYKVENV